jgi:drug/metabolite transporter (DMT)-like permease
MYLIPVFTAIVGVPLLGESVGLYHLVGGALIATGVTLSSRRPKQSAR